MNVARYLFDLLFLPSNLCQFSLAVIMLASEVPIGAVQARRVYIYLAIFFLFYPNLTIRYVQFFAIAKTSVVCNVRAPYSGG